jgi:hypothetical protein
VIGVVKCFAVYFFLTPRLRDSPKERRTKHLFFNELSELLILKPKLLNLPKNQDMILETTSAFSIIGTFKANGANAIAM